MSEFKDDAQIIDVRSLKTELQTNLDMLNVELNKKQSALEGEKSLLVRAKLRNGISTLLAQIKNIEISMNHLEGGGAILEKQKTASEVREALRRPVGKPLVILGSALRKAQMDAEIEEAAELYRLRKLEDGSLE